MNVVSYHAMYLETVQFGSKERREEEQWKIMLSNWFGTLEETGLSEGEHQMENTVSYTVLPAAPAPEREPYRKHIILCPCQANSQSPRSRGPRHLCSLVCHI